MNTDRTSIQLTDMGNSRRFALQHADSVRYVGAWGWMIYDGRRWAMDETGAAVRLARATVDGIFREAMQETEAAKVLLEAAKAAADAGDTEGAEAANDAYKKATKRATALSSWALTSQGAARINAMLQLAQSEAALACKHDVFDADPWLFNCANGTLDLHTGALRPHRQADMLTKLSEVEYKPGAPCPTWLAFLERVQPDPDMRTFLQRSIGYALTGDIGEQCFWFMYGTGQNGKSVFGGIVARLLGDYGMKIRSEALMQKKLDAIPEEIAAMAGKRFALASELAEGQHLNEGLVKDLTGGDRQRARHLYKSSFEFDPQAKLWMYGNHKPIVSGTDLGIWRRVRLVPFAVTIPESERDPALLDKLLAELDGVLAWAVAGCLACQRGGLRTPDAVRMATEEYRTDSDIIGRFLEDCTAPAEGEFLPAGALYKVYEAWAKSEGHKPMSNTTFGRTLTERGVERVRTNVGKQYRGLSLTQSASDFA